MHAGGNTGPTTDTSALLEVKSAVKRFGAVTALDHVDLTLGRREILALLGDNGAGKSTLIKCISGVHPLDDGEIVVDSQAAPVKSPATARALGIETVYQDLALFDNLSAAANFYAGRELAFPSWPRGAGFVRRREMLTETQRILDRLQVVIRDPTSPVGLMSGGQRQAVACARAVAFAQRIVILDEPTASLGVREAGSVLDLVRRLPDQNVSVILISHNLEHVMEVADRAVVLRRGKVVGVIEPSPENHEHIVSLIVGRVTANGSAPP